MNVYMAYKNAIYQRHVNLHVPSFVLLKDQIFMLPAYKVYPDYYILDGELLVIWEKLPKNWKKRYKTLKVEASL